MKYLLLSIMLFVPLLQHLCVSFALLCVAEASEDAFEQRAISQALPAEYSKINAVVLRHSLAVIPGEWDSGHISRSLAIESVSNTVNGDSCFSI